MRRVIEAARVDDAVPFSVHPTTHLDYDDESNEYLVDEDEMSDG